MKNKSEPKIAESRATITEWLRAINNTKLLNERIKNETEKENNLKLLNEITGASTNSIIITTLQDIKNINIDPKKKYCFRITTKTDVIKLYGINLKELLNKTRKLSPADEVRITDFRGEIIFSLILIVKDNLITGACIEDSLYCLTYGQKSNKKLYEFSIKDIKELNIANKKINKKMKSILSSIEIKKSTKIKSYTNIPLGYYEYIEGKLGSAFTDWNVGKLQNNIQDNVKLNTNCKIVYGGGVTEGKISFSPLKDSIFYCSAINLEDLNRLKKVKAIIVKSGSIMSHPSIVVREMKIPCVISDLGNSKENNLIEINFNNAVIKTFK